MPGADPDDLAEIVAELAGMGLAEAVTIGRGGFGVVFRCVQATLGRVVAVKVLSSDLDAESRARFLREEQAMGRLSGHPNILDILQVDVTPSGLPIIVMPFCVRGSLDDTLREQGPLGWADTLRAGVRLAGAIESAHRAGILHRDVKPANVLLSAYGEPQLTDFGIARIPGGFRTSGNLITGSPAYTAPEVLGGQEPSVRSDVYGLGATLFAVLTGHAAFERQAGEKVVAQFLRITTQPVPDLREHAIPDDVAGAIERAMAPDPGERPDSAYAFGELLRAVQRAHGRPPDEMALPLVAAAGFNGTWTGAEDSASESMGPEGSALGTSGSEGSASWTSGQEGSASEGVVLGHMAPEPTRRDTGPAGTVPPTPATKFRPPTPLRAPVRRGELLRILRAGGLRRLALIHAPAGYGKSTLAAQYRADLQERGVAAAWIGIDADDDAASWFLAHLVEAVRRVRPEIGAGLGQVLEERPADGIGYVVATLIDELHSSGEPVVVLIDDWHRITDEGARGVLDSLLGNGCHHLRFVVTTRDQGALPLSRLRVDDELVELDAARLRFSAEETAEVLAHGEPQALNDAQVEAITTATDGWPAAVALAGLSLRTGTDPERLVESFGAHGIGEYLTENVLDALEPRLLDFLMDVSVTERVSGPLATALTGDREAELLLAEAESRELFVTRSHRDPSWFRIQPLFAEYLRARLDRVRPGRSRALHRKASRWFAEHQQLRKSVDHALAAADLTMALDLLESGGMDLIDGSRLATLLGTVSKLPVQQVASRSKLLMAVARANVNLQQSGAARSTLGKLSNLLARGAADDAEVAAQRCAAAVLAAADDVARDRTDGVLDGVADCLARADELPAWTVSTAANLASFVHWAEGDFGEAARVQLWAAEYHAASKDPLGAVFGLCGEGAAGYELLDVETADDRYRRAYELALARSGPRSHAVRLAAAMLGELRYRQGDLEAAAELLDESHRLATRIGPVDFLVPAYVIGARVKALRGDREAALARLDEGALLAESNELARLGAHVRAERLRLGFAAPGEPEGAPYGGGRRRGAAALIAEAEEICAVRTLLARHASGADGELADRAVRRARALRSRMVEQQRPRAELDTTLLLAECLAAAGWVGEAAHLVRPVAATCAEIGWPRPLLDTGPGITAILRVLGSEE
ncbi:protein kinase [Nocardia sp. NPDC057353]|uniref:protein kinase domain-containing protein n=1 Tax=Nocardia sp. NPDC057353 TaxID=3346104 RepID=UPI0036337644